jgi:hypothetical protein
MTDKNKLKIKLKTIYESIIKDKNQKVYTGPIENFEHYNMLWEAGEKDCLYTFAGNNFCMFNYKYENEDSIVMLFGIPLNIENKEQNKKVVNYTKDVNERIMDMVTLLEDFFITLDYISSIEKTEEKFSFLFIIKKLKK